MDAQKEAPVKEGRGLFERDWEVFVIRHDKKTGKFNWFTRCCEKLAAKFNGKQLTAAACR